MSKTISLASIASLLLAASATAQVTNTTNADRCLYNIQSNRTDDRVNSTGVVTIPWETRFVSPWSLTMTFNDSGQRSTPEVRWSNPVAGYLQGYLNVPSINNGNAVVCVYMLPGRNVTSTNSNPNAGNSCEGILSNECVDVISQNIKASQNDCPTFPLRRVPRVKEVCGDTITGEAGSGIAGTSSPINVTTNTCAVTLPQGATRGTGGARTFAAMGLGRSLGITEQGMSDFTYYDRFVRQTVPWVVSVSLNGQVETKVVCVAPSNVTLTSRTPQGPWPPAGGSSSTTPNGAGERVRWTGVYGLLVVGVFLFNSL